MKLQQLLWGLASLNSLENVHLHTAQQTFNLSEGFPI